MQFSRVKLRMAPDPFGSIKADASSADAPGSFAITFKRSKRSHYFDKLTQETPIIYSASEASMLAVKQTEP